MTFCTFCTSCIPWEKKLRLPAGHSPLGLVDKGCAGAGGGENRRSTPGACPVSLCLSHMMRQMRQPLRVSHMSQVSKCGAKTRAGSPCRRPPVRGRKRCRLHGGLSPGAPRGSRNGNYTNGEWTREALEERRWVRD